MNPSGFSKAHESWSDNEGEEPWDNRSTFSSEYTPVTTPDVSDDDDEEIDSERYRIIMTLYVGRLVRSCVYTLFLLGRNNWFHFDVTENMDIYPNERGLLGLLTGWMRSLGRILYTFERTIHQYLWMNFQNIPGESPPVIDALANIEQPYTIGTPPNIELPYELPYELPHTTQTPDNTELPYELPHTIQTPSNIMTPLTIEIPPTIETPPTMEIIPSYSAPSTTYRPIGDLLTTVRSTASPSTESNYLLFVFILEINFHLLII